MSSVYLHVGAVFRDNPQTILRAFTFTYKTNGFKDSHNNSNNNNNNNNNDADDSM